MKKLLTRSKDEPVNCAVALAGQQALMLLHKTKQPRALSAELEKEHPDAKNTRWGNASVDIDKDPKLVVLTLNKAASGLARKLKQTLKGTGFSKVEIRLEDGSVAESASEEEEESEGEGVGTAPSEPGPKPEEAKKDAPPQVDLADLRSQLVDLVKRIPAAAASDPTRLDALKKLAAAANDAVRANDGPGATKAIAGLRQVIEKAAPAQNGASAEASPAATAEVPKGAFVAMQKSRLIWDAARKRIAADINKFRDSVMDEMADDPEVTQVMDSLDGLDDVLDNLDERLMDKHDEALSERDPVKHAALHAEASKIIDQYIAYTKSNDLIKKLEGDTPFGKLTISSTVSATLKALQTSLH
jgi:hypothetical protein